MCRWSTSAAAQASCRSIRCPACSAMHRTALHPRGTRLIAGVLIALVCLGGGAATAADRPPLVAAAKNGDRDAVRSLIKSGTNVNAAEGDGTTALHWAAYRDDLDSADALIRAGAKINVANDLGATPLWLASLNGSAAMARRLLQAGATPNLALLAGETPLMAAIPH